MQALIKNQVAVCGDADEIRRFENFVSSKEQLFDFNAFFPMSEPLDIPTNSARQSSEDWCAKNWGAKSNAFNCQKTVDRATKTVYEFDTHWGEPHQVFFSMFKMFSRLEIEIAYQDQTDCRAIKDEDEESERKLEKRWRVMESGQQSENEIKNGVLRRWYEFEYWE